MTEIKFRAWNPNARMYQGYSGGNIHMPLHEAGALASSPIIFEFQQYTGLVDKNGKDVYEGDIVTGGDSTWVVRWEDNTNDIEVGMAGFGGLVANPSENWEVIGNVHETPELIKLTRR